MNYIFISVSVIVLLISVSVSYFLMFHSAEVMALNGLLFVSNASKLHSACVKASKYVRNVMYVKIKANPENSPQIISKQIVKIYTKAQNNLDIRLMVKPHELNNEIKTQKPIDLIMYDSELAKEAESLKKSVKSLDSGCKMQSIDTDDVISSTNVGEEVKSYEYVALGGTFDRLHNGHKILLSQAVLRSTRHVTVGVTDVNMIQSKKLWELIEPVEKRIEAIMQFLKDTNPDLEYHVFPLKDLYGPTKDDPKYELIVVSEETVRGAVKINEKRKENNLKALDIYVIELAKDPERNSEEEEKVSSSNQRMRLLGTLLRPPKLNPKIPDWPYVIGLAGGIASGKSTIAEKLKLKGAAIINCDIIAHELYKPGLPLNRTIAQNFGDHVITADGEVDRKILGQIVFSDKAQLQKLNDLAWPAVIDEAQRRIAALGKEGHRVVVMEAAVMVKAKWYERCHQLWTVIIPADEAIKRLQNRNGLSEEEARQRIEAQPSNIEQVQHANVVFSSFWSYEYTQSQIDKAWQQLQEYLDKRQ